jgi:hypothetical protein
MQWYPLYQEVEKILGKRLAYLYAYSISKASDCPLCSTYFRKIIIDSGEKPESLDITPAQKDMLDFGSGIARCQGNINDHLYNTVAGRYSKTDMVVLIAFAGQMIATNIFSNVIETDIDEYLAEYLPSLKQSSRWRLTWQEKLLLSPVLHTDRAALRRLHLQKRSAYRCI